MRMRDKASKTLEDNGSAALVHMEQALDLLDQCDAPGEIGANLDLAICRLKDALARSGRPDALAAGAKRAEGL